MLTSTANISVACKKLVCGNFSHKISTVGDTEDCAQISHVTCMKRRLLQRRFRDNTGFLMTD